MRPKVLVVIGCLAALAPAVARAHLAAAPMQLSLEATIDSLSQECRRLHAADAQSIAKVSLHRTFHDDFEQHPLSAGRWAPHYAGGAAWPEARYWGGDSSDFNRKTAWNGEQQIYVDPRYAGRATTPLGLDPFSVRDGLLSITAGRTPPAFRDVLFKNEYISGILTTQGSFSQKFGYFEIRARIPVGQGVWPALWMLADNGGWPPEIDVMEGRGQRPGDLLMTTHWRAPPTDRVQSCGFDFMVPDASTAFHDYGALWLQDRLIYFIGRKPVSDIKVPDTFGDPMYRIVNLAIGAKNFQGVGFVDATSPVSVAFEIDRISVWQIDP